MRTAVQPRFDAKYEVEPTTGCWLWFAVLNDSGYGIISFEGRARLAHRVSWLLHRGSIDDGAFVCHACDTPSCVNPDHLFLGSHTDNQRDMWRKGRGRAGQYQLAKTHCPHGHAYTPENTVHQRGSRMCRTCRIARSREYNRRVMA